MCAGLRIFAKCKNGAARLDTVRHESPISADARLVRQETEGDTMAVVQISNSVNDPDLAPDNGQVLSPGDNPDWLLYSAAGALVAGGLLLVTGNRKAGLVVAATGAALAMLDQQETVRACWDLMPGYLTEIQNVLGRVQSTVDEFAEQGSKLRAAFRK
jgi:hypothetical protein